MIVWLGPLNTYTSVSQRKELVILKFDSERLLIRLSIKKSWKFSSTKDLAKSGLAGLGTFLVHELLSSS
jgi:hypothetical protein